MPNKYPAKKGWKVPKQKYKISNWHNYNEFLLHRGNIEIWLSKEAIDAWYESNRIYDGTGAPKKFSDLAITVCHEIRLVFKLPLRQCQGFINSIFFAKNIELLCPYYSCLSKRLAQLNLSAPGYKKTDKPDEAVVALAIDSTGLKRFGRDEWHQEKHKVAAKRSWCKLHIAVDVNQVTADGAYDKTPVYEEVLKKFPNAEVVIPTGWLTRYTILIIH
ncbi:MAG: IS5 family transposase [Gammaproteobacteria bacterium]|nr:IS5 family transposase [Gammaproteobacteria bacterium]